MIVINQIRMQPHYRRDAFEKGLAKVGYRQVQSGRPAGPEDLLVVWNKYGAAESMANTWEQCGGTVLVCENGYIGRDVEGQQYYAISAHGHNGAGWWPDGAEDRWAQLGIPLMAWREETANGHVLVCGQRGIGSREMASPNGWDGSAARRLKALTNRRIRIRAHPGNQPPATPLETDLGGAYACVIWSSSSGVKALVSGVPVYFDAPHWICEAGAHRAFGMAMEQDVPMRDDTLRMQALRKMAWAQWSVAEIESGEPFARFLSAVKQRVAA